MIVADSYIKIDIERYTDAQFDEWATKIVAIGKTLGGQYFSDVEFSYLIEEGSLKARLKGIAKIIPILWAMGASYPTLKAGLEELASDSARFGHAFTEAVEEIVGADDRTTYRRVQSKDLSRLLKATKALDDIIDKNLYANNKHEYKEKISQVYDILGKLSISSDNCDVVGRVLAVLPQDRVPDIPNNIQEFLAIVRKEDRELLMESQRATGRSPSPQFDRHEVMGAGEMKTLTKRRVLRGTFSV